MNELELLKELLEADAGPDEATLANARQELTVAFSSHPETKWLTRVAPKQHRLLLVAAAVIILTGTISVILSIKSDSPSFASIDKLIADAPAIASKAGTIHRDTTIETHLLGFSVGENSTQLYSETYSGQGTKSLYLETWKSPFLDEGLYMNFLVSNHTSYERASESPRTPIDEKGWFSFKDATVKNPAPIPSSKLGQVLGNTGKIVRLGTAVIDGQTTTGYQVTINVNNAIAQSQSSGTKSYFQSLHTQGVNFFPEKIWLDHAGRMAKLQYSYTTHPPRPTDPNVASRPAEIITTTQIYSYASKLFSISVPTGVNVTPVPNGDRAYAFALSNPVRKP